MNRGSIDRVLIAIFLAVAGLGTVSAEPFRIQWAYGAGCTYLANLNDQQTSSSGETYDDFMTASSWGFNAFVDITKYWTVNLGYRSAVNHFSRTLTSSGYGLEVVYDNTVGQLEMGIEGKYPFPLTSFFSLAPKFGVNGLWALGGGLNGTNLSSLSHASDWQQRFSPLAITFGADAGFRVFQRWIIRVPLDFAVGLNARLSSDFYGSASYLSSTNLSVRTGVEVGYALE